MSDLMCYSDNAHGRIFETEIGVNTNQTVQSCIASCIAQNFTVAGMEFGQECCESFVSCHRGVS